LIDLSCLSSGRFAKTLHYGYHTGSELKAAQKPGVETIVAIPAIPSSSNAPNPAYNVSEFTYSPTDNFYFYGFMKHFKKEVLHLLKMFIFDKNFKLMVVF